jgi:ABC-2 type transport system permease protein
MSGFGVLLRKELLEQWRTWRLLVVGIIFAIFGIGSPILARYTPELVKALAGDQFTGLIPPPTIADAITQFQKNLGQTGILAAILLAMGSVAVEKERGTAAMLLTKPLSRGAFLGAKLTAIAATLLVGTLVAGIGAYAYTALLFSAPTAAGYAAMCALMFLSLMTYGALTFLGSTLTRSSLAAAGIGIGAMVILLTISALPAIGPWTPGHLAVPGMALALGEPADGLVPSLVTTVAVIAAAYAAALLSFRRQEL